MLQDRSNAFQHCAQETQEYHSMVDAGWRPYPPNASTEEMIAGLAAFGRGQHAEWYPPTYEETPIITEGKLRVAGDILDHELLVDNEQREAEPTSPRGKWLGLCCCIASVVVLVLIVVFHLLPL